jgi:hypothetical protein
MPNFKKNERAHSIIVCIISMTVIVGIIALAGCNKSPEKKEQVNTQFEVETLFEKDGCTVYRFYDSIRPIYFTNCKGSTQWTQSSGKTTYSVGVRGN